jgi:xylulokinase
MGELLLGIDVGTYSSKACLCRPTGEVVAEARVDHRLSVPEPGHAEQDAETVWWADVAQLARAMADGVPYGDRIGGMAVSAIGPCLLPVDEDGTPLRPGILYGVDTRATPQIEELERAYGRDRLVELGGMRLTSQAVGPKILWLRQHEPDVFRWTRWFHTASSWIVFRLTGRHVIDRHTGSHFNPLFDFGGLTWSDRYNEGTTSLDRLPDLGWADEIAGYVTTDAAGETGLEPGIPVTCGTVDALAEAISVGVTRPGDLMLMYGSTAFLILVADGSKGHPDLWATAGAFEGQRLLAAGMATTGSATTWFRDQLARELAVEAGSPFERLADEARSVPAGADGLAFLPYFMGERTPLHDASARAVIAGLGLHHTRAHVYRALLEGCAFGIRQILEAMRGSGAPIDRVVAVGGGAANALWLQIVSDVTGVEQLVPKRTVGASYGDAFLAGLATGAAEGLGSLDDTWVEIERAVTPQAVSRSEYDTMYGSFRDLYNDSAAVVHALADQGRSREGRPAKVPDQLRQVVRQ